MIVTDSVSKNDAIPISNNVKFGRSIHNHKYNKRIPDRIRLGVVYNAWSPVLNVVSWVKSNIY